MARAVQAIEWITGAAPLATVLVLLVVEVLLLVHSSLYVLPIYALIMPVGGGCACACEVRCGEGGRAYLGSALLSCPSPPPPSPLPPSPKPGTNTF